MDLKILPIHKIVEDPDQPRKVLDEATLAGLADSIRQHGLLNPITVVALEGVDAYRIVALDAPGRFSWWDYRAGMFHRNEGMRIDLLYATRPVAARVIWAEVDREARKGPPTPSDHAPVVIDLDAPGHPFDPGWTGAIERIAARTKPRPIR